MEHCRFIIGASCRKKMMEEKLDLDEVRKEINRIDDEILQLLVVRKEQTYKVAEYKANNRKEIRDLPREKEIFTRLLLKAKELGLSLDYVKSIFSEIIKDSIKLQRFLVQKQANLEISNKIINIAFNQNTSAFSLRVASNYFHNSNLNLDPCKSFSEVFEKVRNGKNDYAIVPIENSLGGSNNLIYDLLMENPLFTIGEVEVPVEFTLVALNNAQLENITDIYCRPEEVILCNDFIKDKRLKVHYLSDHRDIYSKLKEKNSLTLAGISYQSSIDPEGIKVLSDEIANQKKILTRYIILSRKQVDVDDQIPAKTSVIFSTKQEIGSLASVLNIFKDHKINLLKLESRPMKDNHSEELFYLDFEGNLKSPSVVNAINQATNICRFFRVLGNYPIYEISLDLE